MIPSTNHREPQQHSTTVRPGHQVYTRIGTGRVIAISAQWCIVLTADGEVPVRWSAVLSAEPRAMYDADPYLVDTSDPGPYVYIELGTVVYDAERERFGKVRAMTSHWCVYADGDTEHVAQWDDVWMKPAPMCVASKVSRKVVRQRSVVE